MAIEKSKLTEHARTGIFMIDASEPEDLHAEIAAPEAHRAKIQAIEQGVMQELLAGRTRLL